MGKTVVFLQHLSDYAAHLIIRQSTGILYQIQCGGDDCDYREVEGYLIPLNIKVSGDIVKEVIAQLHADEVYQSGEFLDSYVEISVGGATRDIYGLTNFRGVIVW